MGWIGFVGVGASPDCSMSKLGARRAARTRKCRARKSKVSDVSSTAVCMSMETRIGAHTCAVGFHMGGEQGGGELQVTSGCIASARAMSRGWRTRLPQRHIFRTVRHSKRKASERAPPHAA